MRTRYDWLRSTMLLLVSITVTIALSGCNTMQGAGEDIEEGGEAIQDAAD